jgi:hypothetical protein
MAVPDRESPGAQLKTLEDIEDIKEDIDQALRKATKLVYNYAYSK